MFDDIKEITNWKDLWELHVKFFCAFNHCEGQNWQTHPA